MEVLQRCFENGLGVAPDLYFAFAHVKRGVAGPGFTDEVAEFAQAVFTQGLHHIVADGCVDLNHRTEFFVEQRFERPLVAPHADLVCPVFAVAHIHTAVSDAVTFDQQHIDVQCHADVACKGHLAGAGKQAAVAAVVVSQDLVFGPQCVDGADQIDQVFCVVQIGHVAVFAVQRLRQNAAAHAVLPFTQVNQNQRGVGLVAVELRRECAAHIGQSGKGADDQ